MTRVPRTLIAQRKRGSFSLQIAGMALLMFCVTQVCVAQLNQNCIVSVLNRNVQVNADGTWVLPNIPANFGRVRARATCVQNGVTTSGESDYFTIPTNGSVNVPPIILGSTTAIPTSLIITTSTTTLTAPGATTQLLVTGNYANGPSRNLTAAGTGTSYGISNPAIATISADGLVTAVHSGTVVVQATNEGTQGILMIQVAFANGVDSDGDGIPDDAEVSLGLNPNDPTDGLLDLDHDGLTNRDEYQRGTNIRDADTDDDDISDGQEVQCSRGFCTNPLLADTDGDGIPDGVEIQTGTNPLDPNSFDLDRAIAFLEVKPGTFVLTVNSIVGQASVQLQVLAHLIDGHSVIDLTSTQKGTNYNSSNLGVCTFGSPDGKVFAASNGQCTITVTNRRFAATASGVVTSFTPAPLSWVSIPGYANNVDINGNYAYVAAGSTGLQIVDVSDRSHPRVVSSIETPGNANDVQVIGNYAYVADGPSGVQIVDVGNPLAPVLKGNFPTSGVAWSLLVRGAVAYVARGTAGVQILDIANPSAPANLGSLPLSGTVKGLDIDSSSNVLVVVGTSGLFTVNVSNPAAPALLGSLNFSGDPRDVAVKGNFAYVADMSFGFVSIEITNPASPIFRTSTPLNLGGRLQDVAISGSFALGADVFFVNGVPIIDISNPPALQPRTIVNFPPGDSRGFLDDNATGIAVDGAYFYFTASRDIAENGVIGNTRLYIGQYMPNQDNNGNKPTVQVVAPTEGSTVIRGSQIQITAQAADDVAVALVNILVNGQIVFTATSSPYTFNYQVPVNATTLTIAAQAIDFGNNLGTSNVVTVATIPDPLTTVTGLVVDRSNNLVAGAIVTCLGLSAQTGPTGAFSVAGVATINGGIQCTATFQSNGQTLRGTSAVVAPVPAGTTNVGTITIGFGRILLLADITGPSTTVLVNALTAAGNTVIVHAPEYTWDTTNPALTDFDCVIHLDGATFATPLPPASQAALENFVSNGGGFIGAQWDGYERANNIQTGLPNLVLQLWNSAGAQDQNCGGCNVTYSVVPGQENHPLLVGVPLSFTFFADAHDAGAAVQFATNPSTILMRVPAGGPAVLVRDVGNGRVVNFSWAPNYSSTTTLLNPNVQKLYINAVLWATHR